MLATAALLAGCQPAATPSNYTVVEDGEWLAVSPAVPTVKIIATGSDEGTARGTLRLIAAPDKVRGFDPALGGRFSYDLLPAVYDQTQNVKVAKGGSSEVVFGVELPEAGFYRCLVIADGIDTLKRFNIGFNPEQIVSPVDSQPDFDQFWQTARAELDATPPQYQLIHMPEASSAARKIYLVKMRSLGGEMIQGYYAQPTKPGKHPAIISYMGYGSRAWNYNPDANPDYAEFVLSVRGQALNRPGNKYGDWITYGLDDKNNYYYRGAFMDLVRAVDFIASRPEVDTRFIFACEGSQGGAFTMVAAALDGRITAAAPDVPFLSDYRDYFSIVHWPAEPIVRKQKELGISDDDMYRTLSYFDVKNFAAKISCPLIMGFGLQDPTCPPHTNFSGYNLVTTPKKYYCYPQAGHNINTTPDWKTRRAAFFESVRNGNPVL